MLVYVSFLLRGGWGSSKISHVSNVRTIVVCSLICLCTLSLYCKYYGPRSDSLIRVSSVCFQSKTILGTFKYTADVILKGILGTKISRK